MNTVTLTGRLTADPEIRYTKEKGTALANFALAVDNGYGDKKQTNFIPIVVFGNLAEVIGNNLTKGSKVLVEGRIQVRSYETNEGQKRRVTEIVAGTVEFLDSKKRHNDQATEDAISSFGKDVFPDDEIPF